MQRDGALFGGVGLGATCKSVYEGKGLFEYVDDVDPAKFWPITSTAGGLQNQRDKGSQKNVHAHTAGGDEHFKEAKHCDYG